MFNEYFSLMLESPRFIFNTRSVVCVCVCASLQAYTALYPQKCNYHNCVCSEGACMGVTDNYMFYCIPFYLFKAVLKQETWKPLQTSLTSKKK